MNIPYITIIQADSSKIQKTSSDYIDYAEEGDFFFSKENQTLSGDDGLLFLPVYRRDEPVEFCTNEESEQTQHLTISNYYGLANIHDRYQRCVINLTGFSFSIHDLCWLNLKTQVKSNERSTWYDYSISKEQAIDQNNTDLIREVEEFRDLLGRGPLTGVSL